MHGTIGTMFSRKPVYCMINRIYHHIAEGTGESHPSVHDLQSTARLAESRMLQIMDTTFPIEIINLTGQCVPFSPFLQI